MSISTSPNTAHSVGGGSLTGKAMADELMHGTLAHMRQLRTVVRSGGVLALEAEMRVDGLRHRARSLLCDDAPGDRVTNLTCLALRFAANEAVGELGPHFVEENASGLLPAAHGYVVRNGVIGISGDMGNLRNVIRPVFRREQGRLPGTNEYAGIARNSYGMVKKVAGRNRYIAVPLMKRLRRYPEIKESSYDPAEFTLAETPSGLALAFAKPEEVRAVTLSAVEETAARREALKPYMNSHCRGLGVSDAEGSLVQATWEFMTDTFVANAESGHADRFRRDMVLATSWAAKRLRS